jgi:two-component system phosphate regulon sensor histidine kinase PhoR
MPRIFNSISVTLAAAVGVVVGVVLFAGRLLGLIDGWIWLFVPIVVFAAVVVLTHSLVTRKIRRAIDDLRRIERREFDRLGSVKTGKDELTELQTVIATAGATLEREITAMRRLESYRRDFLGNVSHELKTPIFSIRGFAETLRDGALERPGVRESFVEKIIKNADRLSNLAQDLTEIAKIETGELKMNPHPFALNALIGEVVDAVEPRARNKEMRIQTEVPSALPRVLADESRIRQVLSNLVENGIKYTNSGGVVKIVASLVDDMVQISVSDTGIGIAAEHQSRITERFYRIDGSRSRDQGGTGLGLAIVKHILNAHGQRLELSSAIGKGSTFSFQLPIVADHTG